MKISQISRSDRFIKMNFKYSLYFQLKSKNINFLKRNHSQQNQKHELEKNENSQKEPFKIKKFLNVEPRVKI